METLGLVGSSGTGKSHRAIWVAHNYKVDLLIDDGLLLANSIIIAGKSAKIQPTRIGAVKTALFTDAEHAEGVKEAIQGQQPNRILVLGTSKEMVNKIASRLEIPLPTSYIFIEDIASDNEISQALQIRSKFNRHVIPAATTAVEEKLPRALIKPLKTIFQKRKTLPKGLQVQQTIIRPNFNFYGKFFISNDTIISMINYCFFQIEGIEKPIKTSIVNPSQGDLIINSKITVTYGLSIPKLIHEARNKIIQDIQYITGIDIKEINIHVTKISI
jgi:uncharacterized alkaline shock family protein YloU